MRRFSASAGGNPQSTKKFLLPFVARITSAFPTIHGSVSSPARHRMRMSSGSSWRRHVTHRRRPRTWPRRRRDIHPPHGLESQPLQRRRVESACNRWPDVLPESSSTDSRFRDALPGGTAAGGHDCLRAIRSLLRHFSRIPIIQNFYHANRYASAGVPSPKVALGQRLAALVPESREGAPGPPRRLSPSTVLFRLNAQSVVEGPPQFVQAFPKQNGRGT